jgi:hypothetical protein
MTKIIRGTLATALLLAAPAVSAAQSPADRPVIRAERTSAEIRIDGILDEADWGRAPVATDFTQQRPNPGTPATHRTEARVLFDDRNLYVAMRMHDPNPELIAAQLGRRDATGLHSDWAHVVIDSYFDRRTAFRFSVTPRGVMRDVMQFDDVNEDGGWDAVWEVATRIDEQGWTAEYRIPLSQLRFTTDGTSALVWGVQFIRDIARYEERSLWSEIPAGERAFVSRMGELHGLSAIPAPRRLELRPYVLTRLERAPGDAANPFYRENDPGAEVGLDVMYGLGPNLTLTATINPDFGQVEVDPAVVNLSAFETFFPERRPFFLEGADIFRFGINVGDGGSQSLFYSRRIGRSPRGRVSGAEWVDAPGSSRILGAAKVSGQAGGWSIGALNAVTAEAQARYYVGGEELTAPVEPLTNYAVARLRRNLRGGASGFGVMATAVNRSITDDGLLFLPDAAYTGGLDARHRFAANQWEISGWAAGSSVQGDPVAIRQLQRSPSRYFQRPDAEHLTFDPDRTSLEGLAANVEVAKISGAWRMGTMAHTRTPGFEANDMGFQQEADMTVGAAYLGFIRLQPQGAFRSWNIFTNTYHGWSYGRERMVSGANVNGNFQLQNGWGAYGGTEHSFPALSTGMLRGGPALQMGHRTNWWAGFNSDNRRPTRFNMAMNGNHRHETGGYFLSLNPSVSARPSPGVSLSFGPGISRNVEHQQWVGVPQPTGGAEPHTYYLFGRIDQTTVSLNTRLNVTFNPRLTLELFAQPFVAAGDYGEYKVVTDPRAGTFGERFHTLQEGEIAEIGETATGRTIFAYQPSQGNSYAFVDPSFNVRSLRGNAVLRWEYRPGSSLFLVWQQQRSGQEVFGDFRFGRDVPEIFQAPGRNIFLVKATYWIG